MKSAKSGRLGVTLIELMASLALAGLVLSGAFSLLSVLSAVPSSNAQQIDLIAKAGEGERHFRALLQMAVVPAAGRAPLFGDRSSAQFRTRCTSAGGWLEPCTVSLQLVRRSDHTIVQVREGDGFWQESLRLGGQAALRYLERAWEEDVWRDEWRGSMTAPVAFALVTSVDTLIFLGAGR